MIFVFICTHKIPPAVAPAPASGCNAIFAGKPSLRPPAKPGFILFEKLTKRHIQAVAELFDRCDRYFPSARIHHTIYRGRCQAGACRKLIQMHVSFLADPLKPTHNCILNAHHNHLCGIFEIRKTFRFRRQKYSPHCNSVQRESCAPPEGRSLTDALREMERRISLSFLRASAIPLSGVSFLHTFF